MLDHHLFRRLDEHFESAFLHCRTIYKNARTHKHKFDNTILETGKYWTIEQGVGFIKTPVHATQHTNVPCVVTFDVYLDLFVQLDPLIVNFSFVLLAPLFSNDCNRP
jgi:hypothetical protein